MARAVAAGATSAEVMERVKEKVPTVAKDTVGSTLSRLKADGALTYNGERYYDARFAPKAETLPFEPERINSASMTLKTGTPGMAIPGVLRVVRPGSSVRPRAPAC